MFNKKRVSDEKDGRRWTFSLIPFLRPSIYITWVVWIVFLGACATGQPAPGMGSATPGIVTTPGPASSTPRPTRVTPTPRVRPEGTRTPRATTENRPSGLPQEPNLTLVNLVPLTDMGPSTYHGFEGGLYPGARNEPPELHALAGIERANLIQPLNLDGLPDPNGKMVLLIVGMSNVTQEVCGARQGRASCLPWTFIGLADQEPDLHPDLVIVDGARGGQAAELWDAPTDDNYERVKQILTTLDLSEHQVQAVWVKEANMGPRFSLPSEEADAYQLVRAFGEIARALKVRYPNLQQVFFSSRIYAGYTTYRLNPEPFAYESGFAVKWFVEAQINQMEGVETSLSSLAGDLNYTAVAPWVAWGPYLWANGMEPRSDGLVWTVEDFDARDFTHPSEAGERKVAALLLEFFTTSPFTRCWFLSHGVCEE